MKKKNSLAKSAQIRQTKKFNTSIKNFSEAKKKEEVPTAKMRNSVNNNLIHSTNPPSTTSKARKSVKISTTKKKESNTENKNNTNTNNKRKSIMKKSETKGIRKETDKKSKTIIGGVKNTVSSKKNSMSVSLKRNTLGTNKTRPSKVQNVNLFNSGKSKNKSKTTRKSVEINDIVDEEEIISSKENQNFKDLRNSQAFNKNESIGINIMNNINNEIENNNEDNNIILENENEKNLTAEKPNDDAIKNNQLNSPIQNELIKEKIEGGFINGNIYNVNQENRLKNKKVETSEYISEKNKNTMRNLLYLLERKPEDSKNQNIFRSSLNTLDKREKNKLLDIVYHNRKKIYKMRLEDEAKKINSLNSVNLVKTPNPLKALNSLDEINKIDQNLEKQTPFYPGNYQDKYQTIKNKYLMMVSTPNPRKQFPTFYHDKYFIDYVDGKCPNVDVLERTMRYEKNIHNANNNFNGTISERHKINKSYNDKFHFMEKNDLSVEKRDNRYMYYNYRFMVNTIDDKLNGFINDRDFRYSFQPLHKNNSDFGLNKGNIDSNRNQRVSKLYKDINNDIYSLAPQEYGLRKTFSERNPFL